MSEKIRVLIDEAQVDLRIREHGEQCRRLHT